MPKIRKPRPETTPADDVRNLESMATSMRNLVGWESSAESDDRLREIRRVANALLRKLGDNPAKD